MVVSASSSSFPLSFSLPFSCRPSSSLLLMIVVVGVVTVMVVSDGKGTLLRPRAWCRVGGEKQRVCLSGGKASEQAWKIRYADRARSIHH